MKLNKQKPEKQVTGAGDALAVNSVFHTIQGEGPFAGTPSIFIRLAGCNLQCPMCDTEYTKRDTYTVDEIMRVVRGAHPTDSRRPDLVVITGGEPFRQPLGTLVMHLLDGGYRVQIETNGTLYQPKLNYIHPGLTIVCSPKAGKVHRDLLPWIAAWKYVATAESIDPGDGLPVHALEHPCAPRLYRPPADHSAPVYLQPVDEQSTMGNRHNQDAVVQSCLKHGHRLCLQIHKLVGVA